MLLVTTHLVPNIRLHERHCDILIILFAGTMVNWWDSRTEQKFLEKADCMIKQYNQYTIEQINIPVDGTYTLDENIADNGGTKEAYYAYRMFYIFWSKYCNFFSFNLNLMIPLLKPLMVC